MLRETKDVAYETPDPIARHRIADGARRDGQPKPWKAVRVGTCSDLEQRLSKTLPAFVDMFELRLAAEALGGAERERPDRNSAACVTARDACVPSHADGSTPAGPSW